jgi:uncharacterized membrane protein YGL010W
MKPDRLAPLLNHYAQSHRNKVNEAIHCLCVPAIIFAVLGFALSANLAFGLGAVALALIYYTLLSLRAAMAMACMLGLMLLIWLTLMPSQHMFLVSLVIFAAVWVGQFVGHAIEGAKPSFIDDLQYLMIGPLFVLAILKIRITGIGALSPH